MIQLRFIQFIFIVAISHCASSQSGNPFGSGGNSASGTLSVRDSVPTHIANRINAFLAGREIKPGYTIASFNYQRYFVMVPLKQEDHINLIWSDFHFNRDGVCTKIVTKVSNMNDVDCTILGDKLCASIYKLDKAFQQEFNALNDDIFYINELDEQHFFEVFHPDRNIEKRVIFDSEGNRVNE